MFSFLRRQVNPEPARHEEKVYEVVRALRQRSGRHVSLDKGIVSHEVPQPREAVFGDDVVDISDLNDIIEIDPVAGTCVAEPCVTFVDLVATTLRHGLVPLVVPELKTITVGGAVSGRSLESMSFRNGGFADSCLEYEIVTAAGDVIVARPDNEHSLLFQMMHGSFGTLGILTKLKFRLTEAKPYVALTYEKYRSVADYRAAIWRHFESQDIQFMDGFIHGADELVLSCGRFVDRAPYANRYDWKKVYYRSTRLRSEDYLCTPDYYFRYDHGLANVPPSSFAGRLLSGKVFGSSELLRLANALPALIGRARMPFMLDVFVPCSRADEFLAWYAAEFGHYPLWCVPYRRPHAHPWLSPRFQQQSPDALFVDIATYGFHPRDDRDYHRLMEEKLLELGGFKSPISMNSYSKAEFWSIWNQDNYERVKAITDPGDVFRDLYTKTCRTAAEMD